MPALLFSLLELLFNFDDCIRKCGQLSIRSLLYRYLPKQFLTRFARFFLSFEMFTDYKRLQRHHIGHKSRI